ncbi:helix-turn-helix domain-containing protein [Streptomyces sp. NPDC060048]|uniref:helix-turn-helix domain-containing protein n=1 Tax=unclassified Streptomyces TaxID=2593676 RepID=UPI003697868F
MIGNHLAQHRSLSLVAIGLAAYIQSLPSGARIGIKRLTDRFREGEARISDALRELESHGYLERSRVRLASGRVITRTVSYNRPSARSTPTPEATAVPTPTPVVVPGPEAEHTPDTVPGPFLGPVAPPEPEPAPAPEPQPQPQAMVMAAPAPGAEPVVVAVQVSPSERGSAPGLVRLAELFPEPAPASIAQPGVAHAAGSEGGQASASECRAVLGVVQPPQARLREAGELLARLRCEDPRLLLADRDVRQLAPGLAEWLERGAEPEAVRLVLASDIPDDLRHPARLIGYRLKAWLPPHLPAATPVRPVKRPDPLQNCDGCDRAFRGPEPGRCGDCPPVP